MTEHHPAFTYVIRETDEHAYHDPHYRPACVRSWGQLRRLVATLLTSGALIALLALQMACSDATGPSAPDELAPQFQKVYNGGGAGGHGGGGSGGIDCTKPNASVECAIKFGGLTIVGGLIAGCSPSGVCLGLIPSWTAGAYDYINTPDCRSCGYENTGVGTGSSIGPTNERNLPPGSPPDTGGW